MPDKQLFIHRTSGSGIIRCRTKPFGGNPKLHTKRPVTGPRPPSAEQPPLPRLVIRGAARGLRARLGCRVAGAMVILALVAASLGTLPIMTDRTEPEREAVAHIHYVACVLAQDDAGARDRSKPGEILAA